MRLGGMEKKYSELKRGGGGGHEAQDTRTTKLLRWLPSGGVCVMLRVRSSTVNRLNLLRLSLCQ